MTNVTRWNDGKVLLCWVYCESGSFPPSNLFGFRMNTSQIASSLETDSALCLQCQREYAEKRPFIRIWAKSQSWMWMLMANPPAGSSVLACHGGVWECAQVFRTTERHDAHDVHGCARRMTCDYSRNPLFQHVSIMVRSLVTTQVSNSIETSVFLYFFWCCTANKLWKIPTTCSFEELASILETIDLGFGVSNFGIPGYLFHQWFLRAATDHHWWFSAASNHYSNERLVHWYIYIYFGVAISTMKWTTWTKTQSVWLGTF